MALVFYNVSILWQYNLSSERKGYYNATLTSSRAMVPLGWQVKKRRETVNTVSWKSIKILFMKKHVFSLNKLILYCNINLFGYDWKYKENTLIVWRTNIKSMWMNNIVKMSEEFFQADLLTRRTCLLTLGDWWLLCITVQCWNAAVP